MKIKKYRYFSADFETTVFPGQEKTEVWAAGIVELFTEEVKILHSIEELFDYLLRMNDNLVVYFHNLKFDGSFWLDYFIRVLDLKQAYEKDGNTIRWLQEKDMPDKSFKYSISDRGQWYTITVRWKKHFIEFRDSLKLLPFSVKNIGESFGTKHKKLDMEYEGFRYAGCEITPEEETYIKNDVLVVKEALEIMFNDGHNKLTIGSCCLAEYKRMVGKEEWKQLFPDLERNTWDYVHKSYKGGWCYLVKEKAGKVYRLGTTLDVNSLYPSMMHSESGNRYPIGQPCFWTGNGIPEKALKPNMYYFVRIKTRFHVKHNYLPFIQVKGNYLYKGTEALETSDIWNEKTNSYSQYYIGLDGNVHEALLELTLTMTDYELFLKHYDTDYLEILDGCYFYAMTGIFDEYINHYRDIKINSKGAVREEAKLFLNNLYGKMAASYNSSFKVAYMKENGVIGFYPVEEYNKIPGYIPVGSAITSYSRCFTITAAQKNYHGKEDPGFIYADTDSIHCNIPLEEVTGVNIHDVNFCCWKAESFWDEAIFTRQKTYIEHVTHRNQKPCEPYYDIKCAGMPERCKLLFKGAMGVAELSKVTEEEVEFMNNPKTLKDFRKGLKVPGKLRPKRIRGGILLTECNYEMR